MKYLPVIALVGSVVLANVLLNTFGVLNIYGVFIPAGTFAFGLTFTLRDVTQDTLGRKAVLIAIGVSAILSYLLAHQFALASAFTFALSELCDFAVYTPLRKRNYIGAVVLSNTVGLTIDSIIFLLLAFRSLDFISGQIIGKVVMTIAVLPILITVNNKRQNRVKNASFMAS